MPTPYTDDERTHAVDLYLQHGLAETHHRTGISRPTLRRWLIDAGHDPAEITERANEKTRAATATATVAMEARRVKLRAKLITAAEHAVDQVTDAADGNQAKGWAVAAGIVIDKLRLEVGEATDRTEHVTAPERTPENEAELAKVLKLVEARAA